MMLRKTGSTATATLPRPFMISSSRSFFSYTLSIGFFFDQRLCFPQAQPVLPRDACDIFVFVFCFFRAVASGSFHAHFAEARLRGGNASVQDISLCERFKARAYINPSPKSKEATAVQMLNNLADCFRKRDFQHINRIWNSVAGQVGAIAKRWVIDCDYSENFGDRDINNVVNFIDRECQPLGIVKFITCIPTKNGKHIITTPFDSSHFKEEYPNIDIHKNNPTVLYIPNSI